MSRVGVVMARAVGVVTTCGAAAESHVVRAPPRITIAAAGDIACDPDSSSYAGGAGSGLSCRQLATSNLLLGRRFAAVLGLGDLQYEKGEHADFIESYGRSWGRVKAITHPVAGNHEYNTPVRRGTTATSPSPPGIRRGGTTASNSAHGISWR
jgi:hypothetical protein